ncbi:MAG: homoserine dehydrogenase [Oscillospiraceae bacterium]|nr:homoserine dehydrogenase [Oscillospiraceae bacterium]
MKVAVLGFGTVGRGVYEMLCAAEGLEAGPVLVRPGKADEAFKVCSMEEITGDESVGAVAEVMGGVEPAFSYGMAAIRAGKHFVTSNKALVAAKGIELSRAARENGVAFLFSAACGGGVPFLHNLARASRTDEILSVGGILNGTTNYMLDRMQREGMDYGEVLGIAQKLGYAEADPTADVTGLDALRKIMLACAVAWGILPQEGLLHEGIDSLSAADVADFAGRGYVCRLIASGRSLGGKVSAYVEPVLLQTSETECAVLQNYNLARYEGKNAGLIAMIGQGAGRYPTASAVLRDLSGICEGECAMLPASCENGCADNSAESHAYYVRLPKACLAELPTVQLLAEGEEVRVLIENISVREMHEKAAAMRAKGHSVFFAAVRGELKC